VTSTCSALLALALLAAPAADRDRAVPAHQPHPVDAAAPAPTGQLVALEGASQAYVARPKAAAKGGLLIVHEWWGLNDHIKAEADHYASLGYLALAIDLYGGKVAASAEEAGKLMGALDAKHAEAVEQAGLAWLAHEGPGLKLATIGWCMGGGQSLLASLHSSGKVSATIIYYGMPVMDVAQLKALKGPVLGIWANQDGWITPDKVTEFDAALGKAGVKHEFHRYDADHAFANPTGGRYNPPAAKDANAVTERFLAESLR
jgi:carboxymethylenebutenolidase